MCPPPRWLPCTEEKSLRLKQKSLVFCLGLSGQAAGSGDPPPGDMPSGGVFLQPRPDLGS